eukprot:8449352-Prorocentrum_lima.AAC.1
MAGPKNHLAAAWKLIRQNNGSSQGLILDDPTGPDRYLGCKHVITTGRTSWQEHDPSSDAEDPTHGKCAPVRVKEYDMEEFMTSC